MNRAQEWLLARGEDRNEYNCVELAGQVAEAYGGVIVYAESERGLLHHVGEPNDPWKYHGVTLIEGRVHDAWLEGEPPTLEEFPSRAFPGQFVVVEVME